jgi:hypothetical protein
MSPQHDDFKYPDDEPAEKVPSYDAPPEPARSKPYVQEPVPPIQQQQYIPQQMNPQQTYMNASPLNALTMGSAPVDCPLCGVRAMTRIEFVAGSQTQYNPCYLSLIVASSQLSYVYFYALVFFLISEAIPKMSITDVEIVEQCWLNGTAMELLKYWLM